MVLEALNREEKNGRWRFAHEKVIAPRYSTIHPHKVTDIVFDCYNQYYHKLPPSQ